MVEALIGILFIGSIMWGVFKFYDKGLHLSEFDRELRKIPGIDGAGPNMLVLKKTSVEPPVYVGFGLYDAASKFLCYGGGPGLICDYSQILEWRIIVNRHSVACLSRLTSADLKVDEPDRTLSTEQFLQRYCGDQGTEPVLESVSLKFLIRDLAYPVHTFPMTCAIKQPSLEECLAEALGLIDKFKVLMYSHRAEA